MTRKWNNALLAILAGMSPLALPTIALSLKFIAKVSHDAAFLIHLTGAAATGSSTFVSSKSSNNLTFAINVANDTRYPDDFWFHLSGSNANIWVAVGFGHEMKNALMLIVYADKNGKSMLQNTLDAISGGLTAKLDVTLSRRVGTGHVEPTSYQPINSSISLLDGTGIIDGRYVVNGRCRNCRIWNRGQIDFNSNTQPMIFATGPDDLDLNSGALDAGLRRHTLYGSFSIDLVAAQGDPTPWPPTDLSMRNATANGRPHSDHEYSSSVHAVAMAGTFVVIFPLGIFYMKILRNARWHWIAQAFGVLVVVVGAALGLSMSRYYNRSKNYNSAHQLIGLVAVILILIQTSLGAIHHRIFKAKQQPTIMGVIHRFLGPAVICVGIINGALGFNFALASHHNIGYAIVVLLVIIILLGAGFIVIRRRRRQNAFNTPAAQNFQSAYAPPPVYGNDVPLDYTGPPRPGYSRPTGL